MGTSVSNYGNRQEPLSFEPPSICSRKQVVAHKGKIALLELRLIAKPHLYGTRWNLFLLNAIIGSSIQPRQLGREAVIIDGDALNASIKQSTAGWNRMDTQSVDREALLPRPLCKGQRLLIRWKGPGLKHAWNKEGQTQKYEEFPFHPSCFSATAARRRDFPGR